MPDGKRPKGAKGARAERLEEQLRANLKRRKEQARSRAREPLLLDLDDRGGQASSAARPNEGGDD